MELITGSRQGIDSWLYGLSEEELRLRDHYRSTGSYLTREEYQARYPAGEEPGGEEEGQAVLTDSMFIKRNADTAIVKHPRYLARFEHSHTFFEVSYVVEGSCNHTVNAYGREESVSLRTGDVLILPPAISHSILTEGDSVVVNILLRRSAFDGAFLQGIPEDNVLSGFFSDILYSKTSANYLLFPTGGNGSVRGAVYNILQEYANDKPFTPDILNQLLRLFFLYLLRECGDRIRLSRGYHREARCVPAIVHYLERHYATATVEGMARDLGYTASHLCRLYKKHTGARLRDTLWQIRMRHATGLLLKSDRSVEDIASLVGYADPGSFIRRFRQQSGVTPLQYRKGRT